MNHAERLESPEVGWSAAIEAETKRIIREHLPTIYATEYYDGDQVDTTSNLHICYGKRYLPKRRSVPEKKVEQHLRDFFSLADCSIELVAISLGLSQEVASKFKVLFRKLYTVVSVELHIRTVEVGLAAAVELAGGKIDQVGLLSVSSYSGELFERSLFSLKPLDPAQASMSNLPLKAILIADDAAHSGLQMAGRVRTAKKLYPKIPVVVSVGAMTARAKKTISAEMGKKDKLLFQDERLSMSELIGQVSSAEKRQQINQLARGYFASQSIITSPEIRDFFIDECLRATHIVTPFKLPDSTSNGYLNSILIDGVSNYFSLSVQPSFLNMLYPGRI